MDAISLTKPAARGGAKVWFIARDGATVETRSGTEGKPLKSATETHADEGAAQLAMDKALRTKLRDGYAFVGDRSQAPRGAVVFACFASGGGGGLVADVSNDGRFALTAGHRGAPTGVWVELIDTATGARRVVFEREHPRQLFLLSAHFDRTGERILLTVDDETLLVEIATGEQKTIARYAGANEASRSNFNAHVLRPKSDRARTRWCVFDANTTARVLDERFATVSEIPLGHPTTELRAASISPDGTLIALFRASRGVIYNHADAKDDATQVIELRRTQDGSLVRTIEVQRQVARVTFTPDNARLVVALNYCDGPVLLDASTGAELARARQEHGDAMRAFSWDISADAATLAVGSYNVTLFDAATLERSPTQLESWPGYGDTRFVRFGDDDQWLSSARAGTLTIHKL